MYLKDELYELLRTDESIFGFIQDTALDGLWYWDLENPENRWMNAKYWAVLGYDPGEMSHNTSAWQGIIHQDDLKVANENFTKHCENPEHPYDQVVRYTHKNGSTVWVRCRGMAIRDENGKAIRMLGAHHDITGLRQAEEKFAQAESTYREIFNNMDDSVFIQDIDTGAILDVNDSMLKQFGYERDDIPSLSIADLSAPEEPYGDEHVSELLQRASKGETIVFEWLCRKRDGVLFPGEIVLKPAHLGGSDRIMTVLRDITERKKHEEQLELQAEILDQIVDHVSVTDLNGKILYANKTECNSIGLTKEQVIGKSIEIFGEDEAQGSTQQEILEATLETGAWRGEVINYDKEGNLNRILDCRTTLLLDSNNDPKGLIGVSSDITRHKRAEDKLRQSEESSRKKIQAILDPKGDIGTLNLGDIIDRESLQALISDFYKIARVPTAMVDLAGETLIQVGFQDICVNFHRSHPESMKNCHEAATLLAEGVTPGTFKAYRCNNNLWDIVTPIAIGGKHMGNIFIGQFLYEDETPDYEMFKSQAHQYGFNEAEYLNALDRIPRLSKETVEATIGFYSRLAGMISSLSYSKINLSRTLAEHKRAEEALSHSHELMKYIIEHTRSAVAVHDKDMKYIYVSQRYIDDYKIQDKDIIGKHHYEVFPDLPKKWKDVHQKALAGEVLSAEDDPYVREDGSVEWTRWECRPWHEKDGSIGGIIVYTEVITERKRTEKELEIFKTIAENSVYGKAIADMDGNLVYVNDYFARIHDYKKEELIGKNLSVFHNDHQRKDVEGLIGEMMQTGCFAPTEVWHIKRDGTEFPTLMTGVTVKDEIRNTTFLASTAIDITLQKQTEADLIKAKKQAEESDRLKSAFLANMSHEIRTPMNGILGFAELLKEPDLNNHKQKKYISIIEKSGKRMLNIINDIVDISRIEAGYVELFMGYSDINEIIREVFAFFKPEAEAKTMKLSLKTHLSSQESTIRTDREKIYAVLANLVKNAIKYTEKGEIELGLVRNGAFLEFYVKDTGIGIPGDRQEAIFNRFVQADIEDRMAREGAGLGLAISKAYVEMLGGEIWVESKEGVGSTFRFTVPCISEAASENTQRQTAQPDTKAKIRRLKTLIVDDDEMSALFLEEVIKAHSVEVLKASTGSEAVRICSENPDIDLILMDIRIPDMDGYEATKKIREFNKEVVIISQTAHGLVGDRQKSMDAGCDDYISKPIDRDQLLAMMEKHFA